MGEGLKSPIHSRGREIFETFQGSWNWPLSTEILNLGVKRPSFREATFGASSQPPSSVQYVGPATTQNLVVNFDGEICGGVLVENASDDFAYPAEEARKSPSKLRRKFATDFAENFANFALEIAGA